MVHRHSLWGTDATPCHTVCGLQCDSVPVAYPHDGQQVTCPDCLTLPDRRPA